MPELPDVEIFRQYLQATSLHRKIITVDVKDSSVLEGISGKKLKQGLQDKRFTSVQRHGKYLFVALNDNGWLLLHLGMTGFLKYFKKLEKEPDHDRLCIGFSNGYHLVYADEILFQSGIHPKAKVPKLKEDAVEHLFRLMREDVLPTAIDRRADPSHFPDNYIIPRREKGAHCPKCDKALQQVKVSARTTYLCSNCQRI
jgi:formamidopyrimidine-DNA glycosylase